MGASFREGPARLPDTSEARCLFGHSPGDRAIGGGVGDEGLVSAARLPAAVVIES